MNNNTILFNSITDVDCKRKRLRLTYCHVRPCTSHIQFTLHILHVIFENKVLVALDLKFGNLP